MRLKTQLIGFAATALCSGAAFAQQSAASAAAPTEFEHRAEPPAPQFYQQIDQRHNGLANVNVLGAITGKVTADQGNVHAFRVKAHDIVHKIYTPFTRTRVRIIFMPCLPAVMSCSCCPTMMRTIQQR